MTGHAAVFAATGEKCGWNSDNYDNPRIAKQVPMKGVYLDGMLAWHVLESSLRKGLGSVVPFFCPDHPMWKHWSGDQPALYNAIDADVTLRCWHGIREGLRKGDLWGVFERHIYKINFVLGHMRDAGVLQDMAARARAETKVQKLLDESDSRIQMAVPRVAMPLKVYKKEPKDADTYEVVEVGEGYELQLGERWGGGLTIYTTTPPPERLSVDEMALVVMEWVENNRPEYQTLFAMSTLSELYGYHHTLGRKIRNHFGLWDFGWEPVMDGHCDASPEHPDQISMEVIREVWRRVNNA